MALRKLRCRAAWLLMCSLLFNSQSVRVLTADEPAGVGEQILESRHRATRLSDVPTRGGVVPINFDAGAGCADTAAAGCANGVCVARPTPASCGVARCGPDGVRAGCAGCECQQGYGWGAHPYAANSVGNSAWQSMSRAGHAMTRTAHDWRDSASAKAGEWNEWCDEHEYNGKCRQHGTPMCQKCCGWWAGQCDMFLARNRQQSAILHAHFCGKLAYFTPMGNCGQGAPPIGSYHLVYAANPSYFDPRDAQVYAAQGWGAPMSVPLAPNVRHTMNYSTGIPSSRLTPISTVVPPRSRCAHP